MSSACSPSLSDEHLIRQTLEGDRAAFDLLYERYVRRIYRFVDKRLRNRADVEETVQDVFINVFSSLDSFRFEAPFAAWVLGVARFTVASRFKKPQHPTVPLDDRSDEDFDGTRPGASTTIASPHEIYELHERISRLERAVERCLSPAQRELFELHHLEHVPIAEIAARLDKSEDAVKSNLYRARRLLLSR